MQKLIKNLHLEWPHLVFLGYGLGLTLGGGFLWIYFSPPARLPLAFIGGLVACTMGIGLIVGILIGANCGKKEVKAGE